jgi:hypothetical protein
VEGSIFLDRLKNNYYHALSGIEAAPAPPHAAAPVPVCGNATTTRKLV